MFNLFDRATLRYILEVLGLIALLLACAFHSWGMDGLGVGLLLASVFLGPPPAIGGAVSRWFLCTFAFLMEPVDFEPERGRKPWDLADSAYFAEAQAAHLASLPTREEQLDFFDRFAPADEPMIEPCAYRVTPCGRPTHVRAWGDCH